MKLLLDGFPRFKANPNRISTGQISFLATYKTCSILNSGGILHLVQLSLQPTKMELKTGTSLSFAVALFVLITTTRGNIKLYRSHYHLTISFICKENIGTHR